MKNSDLAPLFGMLLVVAILGLVVWYNGRFRYCKVADDANDFSRATLLVRASTFTQLRISISKNFQYSVAVSLFVANLSTGCIQVKRDGPLLHSR